MKTKAHELLTLGVFTCAFAMQAVGMQPPVRPCCAGKVNQRKTETALTDEKKKYLGEDSEEQTEA